MPPEQLVALVSIIVTAVSGLVLAIFRAFFDAIRKGELVSRTVSDAMLNLVIAENGQLREANDLLRREYLAAGEENRRLSGLLIDRAK